MNVKLMRAGEIEKGMYIEGRKSWWEVTRIRSFISGSTCETVLMIGGLPIGEADKQFSKSDIVLVGFSS